MILASAGKYAFLEERIFDHQTAEQFQQFQQFYLTKDVLIRKFSYVKTATPAAITA
jgi:hypothetical protein